jgi:hypothetical protein
MESKMEGIKMTTENNAAKDLIFMDYEGEKHYVQVESNYVNPPEGKGQKNAVNIFMGVMDARAIDILITVPTEEARSFARAIMNVCDQIDNAE